MSDLTYLFTVETQTTKIYFYCLYNSLYKKWSFPLRISSVNVTKSAGHCGFGHIYWINPSQYTHDVYTMSPTLKWRVSTGLKENLITCTVEKHKIRANWKNKLWNLETSTCNINQLQFVIKSLKFLMLQGHTHASYKITWKWVLWYAPVIQILWRPNFGTVWVQYQLGVTVLR